MENPYYFIDENLKKGFKIKLESHNINRAKANLTILPNLITFEIEFRYIEKSHKKTVCYLC